jgi:hypothetical protein
MTTHVRTVCAALVCLAAFAACHIEVGDKAKKSEPHASTSGSATGEPSQPSATAADSDDDAATANDAATSDLAQSPDAAHPDAAGSAAEHRDASAPAVVIDQPRQDCDPLPAGVVPSPLPDAVAGVTHLQGVISISGDAHVTGKVSVDPGTIFVMRANSSFTFDSGNLDAHGTAALPIRFCGEETGLGSWRTLTFASGLTSDSSVQYLNVSGAGSSAVAVQIDGPVQVYALDVLGSAHSGLIASDFGVNSSQLHVENSADDAVVLSSPRAVNNFPSQSSIANNHVDRVRVQIGDVMGGTLHFAKLDVPYVQDGAISLHADARILFDAGVQYWFAAGALLDVGTNSEAAEIDVDGTTQEPVLFRGETPNSGYYQGIWIEASATSTSQLTHMRLQHGGAQGQAPLKIDASILLDDVTVSDCGAAVTIASAPGTGSQALSITGSASYPLVVNAVALTGLPTGGTFTGNATDMINVVNGGVIAQIGTIPNLGVPYLISTQLSLQAPSDVTLAAGSQFVFVSGEKYGIEVGWNDQQARLVALGSATAPIIFRGQTDDIGTWNGISLNRSASPDSKLDHVQMSNAGLSLGVPVSVTNSSFNKSASFGITKTAADTNDYSVSNSFSDDARGDIGNF